VSLVHDLGIRLIWHRAYHPFSSYSDNWSSAMSSTRVNGRGERKYEIEPEVELSFGVLRFLFDAINICVARRETGPANSSHLLSQFQKLIISISKLAILLLIMIGHMGEVIRTVRKYQYHSVQQVDGLWHQNILLLSSLMHYIFPESTNLQESASSLLRAVRDARRFFKSSYAYRPWVGVVLKKSPMVCVGSRPRNRNLQLC
jgi:hypothetical protein